ncbi:MAG: leucine-rich repeat domain-containing protein [Acetobacterium sp.]|jgi:hypothetical protein|uniref:Leucine-rich repeat protein n=1 Tax=Acetobacterium malicum TaxID=52692 RepID=A0ABR6YX39_9FIRM|nr:leucine-rich repeat protein [Acetobacterium malicum]MBC3899760.1 leucine-rich repeat protein [Acetobacterium malicum]MCG2730373.1 leucine-rich repeat domain-containing protein [Acetobacterium sp.]PKM58735.1 MAG: hypothetical protein CVU99_17095 [Firmicutes bacterium HGW-Firmicutes-4]
MQKIKNGSFAKYLVTLEAHENDLLLFNGDKFIWAFDAEIDDDTPKLMWAAARYFDDYRIVPPLAEIKKYYNNPFCIREGLCFAIDQENNRALLQGSNFHDDERPINSPISPVELVEYQGISYPVTAVADWGFYNNTSVTDLILLDSITQIGNYAFANSIIHDVKMPADISMGKNVFYGCNHLSEKMKNYQDGIKIDQYPQCSVIRKGDVFQTNNRRNRLMKNGSRKCNFFSRGNRKWLEIKKRSLFLLKRFNDPIKKYEFSGGKKWSGMRM